MTRLPRFARWLLRLSPVPRETRADVHADLLELFESRRHERGIVHAHWRLYHDVASLWVQLRPFIRTATPRSPFMLVGDVRGDLRYASRLFARQPLILLLTLVGLSVGLGIATAAFSMMNAAVLRGEGVVDPDRAPGILRATDRSVSTAWSYREFLQLREGATRMQVEAVLAEGAAVRTTPAEADPPAPTTLAFVSGGFFSATGGRVIVGRPLTASDEQQVGPPPVVVSFLFWTTKLNRDPNVVGRTIWIGRTAATIVGVAERRFSVPNTRMLWMPFTSYEAVYSVTPKPTPPNMLVDVFGRLSPTVTLAEAEAQLSGAAAGIAAEAPLRVRLDPNVGLLGASRWRIARQLITESLALGAIASTIGLVLAHWSIPIFATMLEAPAGADLAPDLNVYLFLALVTVVSGVGAGLAPAWHGRGADLLTPLKGDGARDSRVAPRRLRSMLVMTQAAVSVLLIVLATLFVRAAVRAASIDVGFNADGLYAVSPGVDSGRDGAGIRSFWARAIPELQAVPGVAAVTLAEVPPFGDGYKAAMTREQPARVVHLNRTRPDYFDTLGLRILDGRTYTQGEIMAKAPVAVISQSLARAYWPGQSPIGQLLPQEIPLPPTLAPGGKSVIPAPRPTILGVVEDAIPARLYERSTFAVYEPMDPASELFARLIIRVAPGATGVVQQATQRLRAIDAHANPRIVSVAAGLQQEVSRPRMLATLAGMIGGIAIVMCIIGLYGLTASVVSQRTREMGVRVAMGAQRRDLLRLLMWDSLRPVVVGLAIGVAAALVASRLVLAFMFFGVSPHDPIAFVATAAVLVAAATLAVLVPTRRAAATDAALVLRDS